MKHFSTTYKICQLVLACLQNMTLGGILFGWASISGTILTSDQEHGGAELTPAYVHMLFTVANFFSFLGPLLLGIVLDYYGPRVCSLVSITLVTLGCILFSMSDIKSSPWFIPAVCLIAFGGPGAQSAIIHLSNLFPIWKGTATAIITGSFQLSFVVFLIFDQLWQHYQLSYKKLFLSYCVVCVVNALVSLLLWPDEPYSYEEVVIADDIPDPEEQLLHVGHIRLPSVFIHHKDFQLQSSDPAKPKSKKLTAVKTPAPREETKDLKDGTLLDQLRSSQFVMLTIFFLINSFWVNFYIGTFDTQIRDAGPLTDEEAHNYGRVFTLIITCGVVTIPLVGVLMDNYGFPLTSMILISMGVIWSVLLIMNTTTSIFVSFFFYSVYRTFFFTFVFAYLADTLGFKYFGVLAGVMFVLGGVLGILQYPIAEFASKVCVDNPLTHVPSCTTPYWFQVNVIMALTIFSTLAFSYHDYSRRKLEATKNTRVQRGGSSTSVNSTEITPLLRPGTTTSRRTGDAIGANK